MGDQGSAFEWRRKRDRLNKTLERAEDVPWNLLHRGGLVTDSQKRSVYEEGIQGRAEILKAPGKHSISEVEQNIGRFRVRVELPGQDPYEVKLTQSFGGGFEAEGLRQGAVVECRVDPGNKKRVLLVAPEPETPRHESAAATVAAGKPAVGTVKSAESAEIPLPPGTDGEAWAIVMDLRSEDEPEAWEVTILQRVPPGAEELLSTGSELKVGYTGKLDADVAIDWAGSSDGRFS